MLTLILTLIVWVLLNTVIQSDLKRPAIKGRSSVPIRVTTDSDDLLDTPTKTRYTKRVRKYAQEHIQSINLLELLP